MISLPQLIACGIGPSIARAFEGPLQIAVVQFGIATLEQQAGFIAQCMHESTGFAHLEESLWYSSPANITRAFERLRDKPYAALLSLCRNPEALATAAYSSLDGNGDTTTTDGWDFRGGGPFGLTGRANYRACGLALGRPFETQPALVRVPGNDAALSAAWFWVTKGCNQMMLAGDFNATGVRINGANPPNGASERRELYTACLTGLR